MSGYFTRLVANLPRRFGDRGGSYRCGARPPGSGTIGCFIGITFFDLNFFRWKSEFCCNNLGLGGLVALALTLGSHACNGTAGWIDTNFTAIK